MPRSLGSSSIDIRLDHDERFVCLILPRSPAAGRSRLRREHSAYCAGKSLEEILKSYLTAVNDLRLKDEESQFILHLEWEALRSAIVQYLGIEGGRRRPLPHHLNRPHRNGHRSPWSSCRPKTFPKSFRAAWTNLMSAVRIEYDGFPVDRKRYLRFCREAYLSPWEEYFRDGRVECFEFRMDSLCQRSGQ